MTKDTFQRFLSSPAYNNGGYIHTGLNKRAFPPRSNKYRFHSPSDLILEEDRVYVYDSLAIKYSSIEALSVTHKRREYGRLPTNHKPRIH